MLKPVCCASHALAHTEPKSLLREAVPEETCQMQKPHTRNLEKNKSTVPLHQHCYHGSSSFQQGGAMPGSARMPYPAQKSNYSQERSLYLQQLPLQPQNHRNTQVLEV